MNVTNEDELERKRAEHREMSEVGYLLQKCFDLFKCGIFENVKQSPLLEPAVTQLLIWMNDLLQRADDRGSRITFADEMVPDTGDITDLISKMRNAACHMKSKNTVLDFGSIRFGVLFGRVPNAIQYNNEIALSSDYEDDVAVYFGKYRVYLRRQAYRALNELVGIYGIKIR
ncbi:hypothetical protein [Caballeronia sp. dw_19]|uniref:hypothetical protein n=1 Tax=Caballeronia sp. dw_19 TaxID=2719791 RepID=UPI001BCBBE77|nr:hypothetical protein [Caballeronia sp. dw_19]